MGNVVIGTGSYLPAKVVTNQDIEAVVTDYDRTKAKGLSLDEWARQQHGAETRRKVAHGEATSDMATHAARRALAEAAVDPKDLDLIILATMSSDHRLPPSAGLVQANLETKAKFLQVDAACSGFVDAILVAHSLMEAHGYRTVLVIGADAVTHFNHPTRFMPLTIFGDGAGAVVLHRSEQLKEYGIKSFSTGSDGDLGDYVTIPGGASKLPFSQRVLDEELHYWTFKFPKISPWAVDRMVRCTLDSVARAGLALRDIDCVVPHQASVNIIQEVATRLELASDRFVLTYAHTGNTVAASIPIALDEANQKGRFSHGDWLVLPAVGAGMAWGAFTYRWYDYRSHPIR